MTEKGRTQASGSTTPDPPKHAPAGFRPSLRSRLAAPSAALLGTLLTIAAFLVVRDWEAARSRSRFEQTAREHVRELQRSLDREVEILSSLRSLWAVLADVNAEQFKAFVGEYLRSNEGIVALEWLRRVRASERDAFEALPRPDGSGHYVLTEGVAGSAPTRAAQRADYFPVTFAEPLTFAPWNRDALGFDPAGMADRRAALERAKESGELAVLGPVRLTVPRLPPESGELEPPAVLIGYLPIFAGGTPPATASERDRQLLGFASVIFRIQQLFPAVTRSFRTEFMRLYLLVDDGIGASAGTMQRVWMNRPAATEPHAALEEFAAEADEPIREPWSFGQRDWLALCLPTRALRERDALRWSWFTLGLGSVLTVVAAWAVRRLTSSRHRLSREIRQFWRLSAEMLCVLDVSGRLKRVNPAWTALLGLPESALLGRRLVELVHVDDRDAAAKALGALAAGVGTLTFEARLGTGDGAWRWLRFNAAPSDERDALHAVAPDVTEQRFTLEVLEQRASIDSLTGVFTRRALDEKLRAELGRARRYATPLALAALDVDDFKEKNDRHGHVTGDAILRRLGQILKKSVRECDVVGRYGGDEFALVLPETTLDGARTTCDRLLAAVRAEGNVADADGRRVAFTVSIGVAAFTDDVKSVEAFVARADDAMYRAKHAGRDRAAT